MDEAMRRAVAARAGQRCEYCRLHEQDDTFSFHVEHVIPLKHGGTGEPENLAYACQQCNLHKGPNLSGIDPESQKVTSLFHPRQQNWGEHFTAVEFQIVGTSPIGRATVRVLAMNDSDRVDLRRLINFQPAQPTDT
jgi:hypothetical protein